MEALRKTLELLFLREDPDRLLSEGRLPSQFCRSDKVVASREMFLSLTMDQIETVLRHLDDVWMKKGTSSMMRYVNSQPSVFNVLLSFSSEVLTVSSDTPIVRFDQLLQWHSISNLLTEDLFTTSFLASRDLATNRSRILFDWKPCIDHDNATLNSILRKPMAELHSHLKGASLNFELNWLHLMNWPWNRDDDFLAFTSSQNPSFVTEIGEYNKPSLYYLVIKAAAIRLLLVMAQQHIQSNNISDLYALIRASSVSEQKLYLESLKREIYSVKYVYSKRFTSVILDYAITNQCCYENEIKPFSLLTGERSFMYSEFKSIYAREDELQSDSLFYAYLLIKNLFRQELMQTNLYKGFANFGVYERRKESFIPDGSVYSKLLSAEAVASFFSGKSPNSYLEVRITPKPCVLELDKTIKGLLKSIDEAICIDLGKQQFRFILHFIKKREKFFSGPRHIRLRDSVRRCSESLVRWRNLEFNKNADIIVGIDAANSELYCRPEVFSQAYRFCRHYSWNNQNRHPNELHFTYHVGEDFYDVIDGLRAIWEAVHFLGLGQGDRIGHGLILGTNVNSYYDSRHGLVFLPKQVLLDNIVWVLHEGDFNGPGDKLYRDLNDIYLSMVNELYGYKPLLEDYFQSMCLRGDNPQSYTSNPSTVSKWNLMDFCNDFFAVEARKNDEAIRLYKLYHFNADTVRKGNEVREFLIQKSLIEVVDRVRSRMLHVMEEKGIAIETNPTSNLRIGHASSYMTLPLLEFNNVGINKPERYRELSVSINTDDRGVFGTSLEREFSLVAASLEKQYHKGESDVPPRLIYEWLDGIREMAFEQRFVN